VRSPGSHRGLSPGRMTSYIEADVRDTEEILGEAVRKD
jgi:hypothetical protein